MAGGEPGQHCIRCAGDIAYFHKHLGIGGEKVINPAAKFDNAYRFTLSDSLSFAMAENDPPGQCAGDLPDHDLASAPVPEYH